MRSTSAHDFFGERYLEEESVVRNQCGGLFSGAEPVRNQCGPVRKSVQSCFIAFVFHVFGSLVRNQCVTSAESLNSAEPVRNQCAMNHVLILVDIGGDGGWWAVGVGWWVLRVGCWVLGASRWVGAGY